MKYAQYFVEITPEELVPYIGAYKDLIRDDLNDEGIAWLCSPSDSITPIGYKLDGKVFLRKDLVRAK